MNKFLETISTYRYPSIEELIKIQEKSPRLKRLGFKDQLTEEKIKESLIEGTFVEYDKLTHLYEWDQLLADKIVDLQKAYVYVLVHFRRGVPATAQDYINNVSIRPNYDNLKFYFTYLHYIIVSIVDNILQIINVYYRLELPENKVCKDKIINKLREKLFNNMADEIKGFYDDFFKYLDLRNSLAHRFSPYAIDRRSELDENIPDKITLGFNNDFQDFENEIVKVEEAFDRLRSFMDKLRTEFGI